MSNIFKKEIFGKKSVLLFIAILLIAPKFASAATITISGTVYIDESGTTATSGNGSACNGGNEVAISVNGAAPVSTSCDGVNANFSTSVTVSANDIITIFLNGQSDKAVTYTNATATPSNIANIPLTKNRITIFGSISNTNIGTYDQLDDSDIPVMYQSSVLTASSTKKIVISTGKTYTPGATTTVDSIEVNGTYLGGTEQLNLIGSGSNVSCTTSPGTMQPLCITGTFNAASSTKYSGTSANIATTTYKDLTIGGSGTYTFPNAEVDIAGNLIIANGATVTKGSGPVKFNSGTIQSFTDNNSSPQDIGNVQVSTGGNQIVAGTISLLSHGAFNTESGYTGAVTLDTTGANLIVVGLSVYDSYAASSYDSYITDNMGNTYTRLDYIDASFTGCYVILYYSVPTSVGANHTITINSGGNATYPNITVAAFSGVSGNPVATTATKNALISTNTIIQPGSLLPPEDKDLLITIHGANFLGSATIDSPFTVTDSLSDHTPGGFSGGMAYEIQTTATSRNPTWTTGPSGYPGTVMAAFKAGTSTSPTTLNLGSSVKVTSIIVDSSQTLSANGSNTITITGSGTGSSRPFKNLGTFTPSTGTVVYSGNGDTSIETTNTSYNNLSLLPTLSVSSKSYTVNGALTVTGDLNINPTAATTLGLNVILGGTTSVTGNLVITKTSSATSSLNTTVSGYVLNAGTIDIESSGTLIANGSNITLSGSSLALTINGTFTSGTSTVQYTGTTATVSATTFNNLTIGGTGTYTMPNSNITINGNLVITNGATVAKGIGTLIFNGGTTQTWTDNNSTSQDIGKTLIATAATSLQLGSNAKATSLNIVSSTTFTPGSHTLEITGTDTPLLVSGTFTSTNSTIKYSGVTSTVASTTFNNLTLGGTGTYTMPNSEIDITGNLIIGSGATITKGSGTVKFNGGTTQTWTDNNTVAQDIGDVQISSHIGGNTVVATDDFNRADSGSLGSNWTNAINGYQITSNIANPTAFGDRSFSYWSHDSFNDNQYSQAVASVNPYLTAVAVRVGGSGAATRGYYAMCGGGTTGMGLAKTFNVGVLSQLLLGSNASASCVAGDTIRIEAQGTTITAYLNGVQVIQVTDSTYTSGSPGIHGSYTGFDEWDNWEGGNLGDAVEPSTLDLSSSVRATSLTIDTSQTFVPGSHTLTLTGSSSPLTINGTFAPTGSTVNYVATSTVSITPTIYNNLGIGTDLDSNITTYKLTGSTTVMTNLTIGTSTATGSDIFSSANNYLKVGHINISSQGNFSPFGSTVDVFGSGITNNGTFTYGTSTVNLTPAFATSTATSTVFIQGSSNTSFYNLNATSTVTRNLKFGGGIIYGIYNSLTLSGDIYGGNISLNSNDGTSPWSIYIDSAATYSLGYLSVRNASCAQSTKTISSRKDIIDNGNNGTCWSFNPATRGSGNSGVIQGEGSGSGTQRSGGIQSGSTSTPAGEGSGSGSQQNGGGSGGGNNGSGGDLGLIPSIYWQTYQHSDFRSSNSLFSAFFNLRARN